MSRVEWHGEEFEHELERGIEKRLFLAAETVLGESRRLIDLPKSGKKRSHKRLKSGRVSGSQFSRWQQTQRSAPGEAPARQTSTLYRSLTRGGAKNVFAKLSPTRYRIGTNVEYAKYLTRGTGKMAARPFLKPALENVKAKVQQLFNVEIV